MNILLFAHNGVEHANHMEATTHEASTTLWLILATLIIVAGVFGAVRMLTKTSRKTVLQEEEEDTEG